MLRLFTHSLRDLRLIGRQLFVFEYVYMLITGFMIVPLLAYIFNRILIAVGSNVLLNKEVYQLAASYEGVLGIGLILLLCALALFIEMGVVIVLAHKRLYGERVLLSDALATTLRAIPRLMGLGPLPLGILVLGLLPIIESPLSESFFGSFNLSILLTTEFTESRLHAVLYVFLLVLAIYISVRFVFAHHFIVAEGMSAFQALRSSFRLTKARELKLILYVLLLNCLLMLLGFLVLWSLSWIPALLPLPGIRYVMDHYYLLFSGFLTYAFALLVIPANLILVTRLFYMLRRKQGWAVEDRLVLTRYRFLSLLELRLLRYVRTRYAKLLVATILAIYLVGSLVLSYSVNDQLAYLRWDTKVAAHRGDTSEAAPENSISAIQSAIDKQVDVVEIDVQMTRDGVVVLNHDYTLLRVAGVRTSVHDLSYGELSELRIGDERIPTLAEALVTAKGKAQLIVEIKPYGNKVALARETARLIEAYGMIEECYIQSFDTEILREVRLVQQDIKLGQILFLAAGNLSSLDVDFYTIEQSFLSDRLLERARKQGREVWVWTVNLERNMKKVLQYPIDGIITDYPEKVQVFLGFED